MNAILRALALALAVDGKQLEIERGENSESCVCGNPEFVPLHGADNQIAVRA